MINARKASNSGVEASLTAMPVQNLTLTAGIGTSNLKFDDFKDAEGDYKGNKKPFSPDYNFHLGADYRFHSGIYLGAHVTGSGDMYVDKENTSKRDAYQLLNLKAGYETASYDLYLYADNVFDKEYDYVYKGDKVFSEPMEAGVSLTCRF